MEEQNNAETQIKPGELKTPNRIHYSAFEAAGQSAKRLGYPEMEATFAMLAQKARNNGGWLE